MLHVQRSKLGFTKGVKGYPSWASDTMQRRFNEASFVLCTGIHTRICSEDNFAAFVMTL